MGFPSSMLAPLPGAVMPGAVMPQPGAVMPQIGGLGTIPAAPGPVMLPAATGTTLPGSVSAAGPAGMSTGGQMPTVTKPGGNKDQTGTLTRPLYETILESSSHGLRQRRKFLSFTLLNLSVCANVLRR